MRLRAEWISEEVISAESLVPFFAWKGALQESERRHFLGWEKTCSSLICEVCEKLRVLFTDTGTVMFRGHVVLVDFLRVAAIENIVTTEITCRGATGKATVGVLVAMVKDLGERSVETPTVDNGDTAVICGTSHCVRALIRFRADEMTFVSVET